MTTAVCLPAIALSNPAAVRGWGTLAEISSVATAGVHSYAQDYTSTRLTQSDYYGAIAYSKSSGRFGSAWDAGTQEEAEQRAVTNCRTTTVMSNRQRSGQTVNGISLSNPTKVLYHFGDSSVPPQYHRSYTITVTKSDAKLVVDSYGNIVNESTISITDNQFNGILETIRASKIGKRKALNDNEGCTGGTSESLEIYEGDRVLFDADVYHCGTKEYGSLTGNIAAIEAKVASLFPDFKERLK